MLFMSIALASLIRAHSNRWTPQNFPPTALWREASSTRSVVKEPSPWRDRRRELKPSRTATRSCCRLGSICMVIVFGLEIRRSHAYFLNGQIAYMTDRGGNLPAGAKDLLYLFHFTWGFENKQFRTHDFSLKGRQAARDWDAWPAKI